MILPTIDDFPGDKPNCGNCTRKGGICARSEKRFPNGYVKSSVTGEISGIIYRCAHWTGRLAVAMLLMTATATAQTTNNGGTTMTIEEFEKLKVGDKVRHPYGGIGIVTEIDEIGYIVKDKGFDTGDGLDEVSFAWNEGEIVCQEKNK